MEEKRWDAVPNHRLGKSGESFADWILITLGYEVFRPIMDDGHGIDRVVRERSGRKWDAQVKAARNEKAVILRKDKFPLREDMALVLVHFQRGQEFPDFYRVPATAWKNLAGPFCERTSDGRACWCLDLSRGLENLRQYLMTT